MCVCVRVCMYVYMYAYMYVCMYVCMYTFMYVYLYVCVCMYVRRRFLCNQLHAGYAVAQLVEALLYKLEGRGFDSRWCHWNFSLT